MQYADRVVLLETNTHVDFRTQPARKNIVALRQTWFRTLGDLARAADDAEVCNDRGREKDRRRTARRPRRLDRSIQQKGRAEVTWFADGRLGAHPTQVSVTPSGSPLAVPDFASIAFDMRATCIHHFPMSTMIQIRDVPETLHRQLKSRAALAGMSLSGYLLDEIRRIASQPTLGELRARLAQRSAVDPSIPPADAVRAERDRL